MAVLHETCNEYPFLCGDDENFQEVVVKDLTFPLEIDWDEYLVPPAI
jgi:hypothetical protein